MRYVIVRQNEMDKCPKTLDDLSKLISSVTIHTEKPRCPFAAGVFEVHRDGTIKCIESNFDTSD